LKNNIINIVGIDGSGKSTLGEQLTQALSSKGLKCRLIYCQYFAKLLYPVKRLAKATVMKDTDEFADYKKYITQKTGFSQKHKVFGTMYAILWLIDYSIQAFCKVNNVVRRYDVTIIDRYFFDIVVNICVVAGWPIEQANKILRLLFRFHPKPDVVIFIDVPEKIAFSRKDDIQSIHYLRERRELYLLLAMYWNFVIIDGTKNKEEILSETTELVHNNLIR